MSDMKMYNILGNFNNLNPEMKEIDPKQAIKEPVYEEVTAKGSITEAVNSLEEKYMGFKAVEKAAKKGGAENPAAVAASIGRKKYGKAKFQKAAAAGKKMGESIETVYEEEEAVYIGAQPKKKVPVTKKDEYDGEANMAKGQLKTAADAAKELEHILHSDENIPEWIQAKITLAKEFLETSKDVVKTRHDRGEDYVGEAAKPDFLDLDKDGDRKESMKKAAKDAKKKSVDEGKLKDKKQFDAVAKTGDYYITSKGNKVIKTDSGIKHEKVHAADKDDDLDESIVQEKAVSKQQQKFMGMVHAVQKGKMKAPSKEIAKVAKGMTKKAAHDFAATKHKGLPTKVKEGLNESIRNHPIYTDKAAWDHYKKELDEEQTMEGVRNVQQELDEIARLAGVPVACPKCSSAPCKCEESLSPMAPADSDSPLSHCNTCNESPCSCMHEDMMAGCDEGAINEAATRKDFRMVADLIKNIPDKEKRKELAHHHAGIFKQQNPRFKHDVFCKACGLDECDWNMNPGMTPVEEMDAGFAEGMMDEGKCPTCDCAPCKCDEGMMDEQEVDEGNPLTKGLADKSIPVGGKIKVGDKEIIKTKQIESTDLEPVKEDININISANGEQDALNLIRKLSGMAEVHAEPVIAVGEEEELDEQHANHNVINRMTRDVENLNTPREDYAAADITTMTGTGLDKKKTEIEFAPPIGDNPLQAKKKHIEVGEGALWKQYEAMLNEITE